MPFAKAIQNDQSNIKTKFGMITIRYTLYFECKLSDISLFSKSLKYTKDFKVL